MITINNKFRNTNSNTINLNATDKDSDRVSRKDLHEKLWESRSFEINHLWQRSIFLATFIVALFTLYFSTLNLYYTEFDLSQPSIEQDEKTDESNRKIEYKTPVFLVLETICFFGFQFSVLWICMARGSKYMYERHENGIEEAYRKGSFEEKLDLEVSKEFYEVLWESGDYTYIPRHGALPLSDYDYRAMHLEGGKFSSSKINIIIGYIFSSVWILLTLLSAALIYRFSCCFFLCLVTILLELFCALYTSYRVLSDNSMKFGEYFRLVFGISHIGKWENRLINPDERQRQWIIRFVDSLLTTRDSYIWTHVNAMLEQYQHVCDNALQRYIIECFFVQETLYTAFKWIQSNEYLWHLFSTAIMYRESFSIAFQGLWLRPNSLDCLNIRDDSIWIHLGDLNLFCELNTRNNFVANALGEARLFADTDWQRIRSGHLDYDLIEDARCQHLIWKEVNGDTLYMTMDISLSISDLEFYYHRLNDDIDNSELIRMKVSIIWKNKKYEYTLFRS